MKRRPRNNKRIKLERKFERGGKGYLVNLVRVLCFGILVYLGVVYIPLLFESDEPDVPDVVVISPDDEQKVKDESLDKGELAGIIGNHPFQPDELHSFRIDDEAGHALYVRTTLDPELQAWALSLMPKVKARAAALVVMDPRTGEVLTMASHRADGRPVNEALASSFPAASLFKIVTAAAAVEKEEMTSRTKLAYDGGKHTLYKGNLKEGIDKGRHQVTLKEGFADSINTVFGKLGAFTLGRNELESFARRFHFNQPISFEMPVQKSRFNASDEEDPFRLAELASGFNRTTKVSPLHGAMLAAAIVNNGRLMEPTVVREVFDLDNRIYYQHRPVPLGQVVSKRTVKELLKLMRATVTEGTGRRGFWDAKKHKILSRLEIGGKSGTISDDEGHKVDWFVSFAKQKGGKEVITLAAVVVHNPKLGMRSQEIIRQAVIRYYKARL